MTSLPRGFSTDSPDIRERAERLAKTIERAALFTRGSEAWLDPSKSADLISQALTAEREAGRAEERERLAPARLYFDRYCQDEAEDEENCVCGKQQHEDAKAFAAAIRNPET